MGNLSKTRHAATAAKQEGRKPVIVTDGIPAYMRESIAVAALDGVNDLFGQPGASQRFEKWLADRKRA